jgi:hypothetical protein
MNQRINRKAIFLGLILAMGIILTGFGIRKAISKETETCSTQAGENEPRSQGDFHILEAISHMVLLNR